MFIVTRQLTHFREFAMDSGKEKMSKTVIETEINNTMEVHPDLLSEAKAVTKNIDRKEDIGFINKKSKSSVLVRGNGNITMAASLMSQYRLDSNNGYAVEHSIESDTVTIRKRIEADEIVINDHKLNPALYEMSDMRQLNGSNDSAIGNMTLFTSVLVKAWEPTLKKWVLMRRLARIPAFSPTLNLPSVPQALDLETDIADEIKDLIEEGRLE